MIRTGLDRLNSIAPSVADGEEFRSRIKDAEGDTSGCADLMAEAIEMNRRARGHEMVGRDGRDMFSMEELQSYYCLDAAREAYLRAKRSNAS